MSFKQLTCAFCGILFGEFVEGTAIPNSCPSCRGVITDVEITDVYLDVPTRKFVRSFVSAQKYNELLSDYLDAKNLIEKLKDRILALEGEYDDIIPRLDLSALPDEPNERLMKAARKWKKSEA